MTFSATVEAQFLVPRNRNLPGLPAELAAVANADVLEMLRDGTSFVDKGEYGNAIPLLQRILEQPEDGWTEPVPPYLSVKQLAEAELRRIPKAELRLGMAKWGAVLAGLSEQRRGPEGHKSMVEILSRFPWSDEAKEICVQQARLWLDRGDLHQSLIWRLMQKDEVGDLNLAWHLVHRADRAQESNDGMTRLIPWGDMARQNWLQTTRDWSMAGGEPGRSAQTGYGPVALQSTWSRNWTRPEFPNKQLPSSEEILEPVRGGQQNHPLVVNPIGYDVWLTSQPHLHRSQGLGTGEKLVVPTPDGLQCFSLTTGHPLWKSSPRAYGLEAKRSFPARFAGGETRPSMIQGSWGAFTVSEHTVYLTDSWLTRIGGRLTEESDEPNWGMLSAFDLSTGKLLWEAGGKPDAGAEEVPLSGISFLGAPAFWNDRLVILGRVDSLLKLLVISPGLDGQGPRIEWSQTLLNIESDSIRDIQQIAGLAPTVIGPVAYCPTLMKRMIGVNLAQRRLLWDTNWGHPLGERLRPEIDIEGISRERRSVSSQILEAVKQGLTGDAWFHDSPMVVDGRLVCTPRDLPNWYCLDIETGATVWEKPRGTSWLLLGGANGLAIVVGPDGLTAHSLQTGSVTWQIEFEQSVVSGQGLICQNRIVVPVISVGINEQPNGERELINEVLVIELSSGTILDRKPLAGEAAPQNLSIQQGWLVATHPAGITAYGPINSIHQSPVSATSFEFWKQNLVEGTGSRLAKLLSAETETWTESECVFWAQLAYEELRSSTEVSVENWFEAIQKVRLNGMWSRRVWGRLALRALQEDAFSIALEATKHFEPLEPAHISDWTALASDHFCDLRTALIMSWKRLIEKSSINVPEILSGLPKSFRVDDSADVRSAEKKLIEVFQPVLQDERTSASTRWMATLQEVEQLAQRDRPTTAPLVACGSFPRMNGDYFVQRNRFRDLEIKRRDGTVAGQWKSPLQPDEETYYFGAANAPCWMTRDRIISVVGKSLVGWSAEARDKPRWTIPFFHGSVIPEFRPLRPRMFSYRLSEENGNWISEIAPMLPSNDARNTPPASTQIISIDDDRIVLLTEDAISGFDTHTGQLLWRRKSPQSPGFLAANTNVPLIVDPKNNLFELISSEDGSKIATRTFREGEYPFHFAKRTTVVLSTDNRRLKWELIDMMSGQVKGTWTTNSKGRWFPLDDQTATLWNGDDEILWVNVHTGVEQSRLKLEGIAASSHFRVIRLKDCDLILLGNEVATPTRENRFRPTRIPVYPSRSSYLDGVIIAVSPTTGEQIWRQAVREAGISLDQNPGAPFLICASTTTQRQNGASSRMLVLDLKHGTEVFDQVTAEPISDYLLMPGPNNTWTLQFDKFELTLSPSP